MRFLIPVLFLICSCTGTGSTYSGAEVNSSEDTIDDIAFNQWVWSPKIFQGKPDGDRGFFDYTSKAVAEINDISSHDAIVVTRYFEDYLSFYFYNESLDNPVSIANGKVLTMYYVSEHGASGSATVNSWNNEINDGLKELIKQWYDTPGGYTLSLSLIDAGVEKRYSWNITTNGLLSGT